MDEHITTDQWRLNYQDFTVCYTPNNEVEGGILESSWLSVCLSVGPSVRGHNFVWNFSFPTVLHVML